MAMSQAEKSRRYYAKHGYGHQRKYAARIRAERRALDQGVIG